MNLHGIATPCIGSVNPSITATFYLSDGYVTQRGGSRVPMYTVKTDSIQVQSLSESAQRHMNELNIGGILRRVYITGVLSSIVRADQKGGDLLTFTTNGVSRTWMVVHVLEQWPDWCAVVVQQQVVPVVLYHRLTASAGENGAVSPFGLNLVLDGGSQEVVFTPNAGYAVQDVLIDGESVGAVSTYTFENVTADHTISVSFYAVWSASWDCPTDVYNVPVDDVIAVNVTIDPAGLPAPSFTWSLLNTDSWGWYPDSNVPPSGSQAFIQRSGLSGFELNCQVTLSGNTQGLDQVVTSDPPPRFVLLAGGSANGITNTSEIYGTANNHWSAGPNMSFPRQQASISEVSGGYLITGGNDWGSLVGNAEIFSTSNNQFRLAQSDMVHPRSGHVQVTLANGDVLLIGGNASGTSIDATATAEVFDHITETFSSVGNLSYPRSDGHRATLLSDGTVLVTGGTNPNTGGYVAQAELYDPTARTFTTVGSMSYQRSMHTATLIADDKVVIIGGAATDEDHLQTFPIECEIYDPSSQTFSLTAGSLPGSRWRHGAITKDSSQVLIFAGMSGITYPSDTKTVLAYNIANQSFEQVGTVLGNYEMGAVDGLKVGALQNKKYLFVGDDSRAQIFDSNTNETVLAGAFSNSRLQGYFALSTMFPAE